MGWYVLLLVPPLMADGFEVKGWKRPHAPWDRPALQCPPVSPYAPTPMMPGQPPPTSSDPAAPPQSDSFQRAMASAGEGGTQSGGSYAPGFFGDFVGGCVLTDVVVFTADDGTGAPGFCPRLVCLPTPSQAGGYKAAENESPRPINRAYYHYTFYGNIDVTTDLSPDAPPLQLSRHILGFEKTFLGGDASIGMRLPFLSFGGDVGYQAGVVADLVLVTKYAFRNNRQNGNVLSGGLVMTVPSGGTAVFFDALTGQRNLRQNRLFPVVLQPWGGYVYNFNPRLYIHGVHSLAVPTDSREFILLANDIGVGYWIYRSPGANGIQAIIPTTEIHVNTPLNNRPPGDPNGSQSVAVDSIVITTGLNFMLPRSILGGAVAVPITGVAAIEAMATWTMRW